MTISSEARWPGHRQWSNAVNSRQQGEKKTAAQWTVGNLRNGFHCDAEWSQTYGKYLSVRGWGDEFAASQVLLIFTTWLKFTLCRGSYVMMTSRWRPPKCFDCLKKKTTNKKIRLNWNKQKQSNVVKVSTISTALKLEMDARWDFNRSRHLESMETSNVCFWNQWNPWKHQPVQIKVTSTRGSSSLWLWLTRQIWTEQRAIIAALWLALIPAALHRGLGSPLNVIIT